ncbi:MAG: hypothetical protein K2H40_09290, partial [Lachnospiraceae bacterium]|nr:hypothetical protein [Lachnospiraceae bacterium]
MEELKTLNYCLQAAKRAYDQETVRQRHAMDKAEYLFKYLTLLTTAFNIAVSVISKMNQVNTTNSVFFGLYILMLTAGIIGIVGTLMIQIPRKTKQFALGTEELKRVQSEPAKYRTDMERTYQEILWMDTITIRLRENND